MPIIKIKYGWKITNTSGISKTKNEAKQRLRAIKWRQKRRKRRNKRRR